MKHPKKNITEPKNAEVSTVVNKGTMKRKHDSKMSLISFLGLEPDELARLKGESNEAGITKNLNCVGRNQKRVPEVVVFHDPSKNTRKHVPAHSHDKVEKDTAKDEEDGPIFNLKDASFEVRKYGIKAMKSEDKEAATIAMLVKLGAKPPKKKYLNYKVLQDKIKLEKEHTKQKLQDERDGQVSGITVKPAKESRQFKRKTNRNDVGYIDGQIGRYKNGIQVLSKADLHRHDKQKLRNKH